MILFKCPTCDQQFEAEPSEVGRTITCDVCHRTIEIPAGRAAPYPTDYGPPPDRIDAGNGQNSGRKGKYCTDCGEPVALKAAFCGECGAEQERSEDSERRGRRRERDDRDFMSETEKRSRETIKVVLLVSAISNIVVGSGWALTCVGLILTIPMFILCIFEFTVYSNADRTSSRRLHGHVTALGICEIIVGIFNTISLVCGIIALVHAGGLTRYGKLGQPDA